MNTTTFNPGIAYATYNKRLVIYAISALTAFLMSAYFVVGYMVGDIHFWQWGQDQWANALPGIGITFAMTAFQAILYANRSAASKGITILSICVAAGFSILSELGQGMERDNIRMETKSIESPTYQALVGSLAGVVSSSYSPYSGDLQQAQARLATCQKKMAQGVYADCAESQARVQAVEQMIALANESKSTRALALAQTAKGMERDENNYHPLVNLIRNQLGVAGIVASFLLSLTIICLFEYAFHYLGARYAESRDELLEHGYDTTRRTRRTPRVLPAANDASVSHSPARHKKGNPVLGTAEEQLDLSLPADRQESCVKTSVYPESSQKMADSLHVRVGEPESCVKPSTYEAVSAAKVGAVVDCPQCGETFRKSNKWHTFCQSACKDNWHNERNPERLEALRKKRAAA